MILLLQGYFLWNSKDIFTIYDVKKITNENKLIFYQYCIVIVIVVYQVKMKVLSVKVKTFNLLIKTWCKQKMKLMSKYITDKSFLLKLDWLQWIFPLPLHVPFSLPSQVSPLFKSQAPPTLLPTAPRYAFSVWSIPSPRQPALSGAKPTKAWPPTLTLASLNTAGGQSMTPHCESLMLIYLTRLPTCARLLIS